MYKNMMLAVDFNSLNPKTVQTVQELIKLYQAKLYLIQILSLEYILTQAPETDIIDTTAAQCNLQAVGANLHVPLGQQFIEIGETNKVAFEFIDKHNIDLLLLEHNNKNIFGYISFSLLTKSRCSILLIHTQNTDSSTYCSKEE